MQKNTTYFTSLTGFRCFAASLVFIYHNRKYWRNDLYPGIIQFINEFHIGVSLFFVLSGFLITYTYFDKPLSSVKAYRQYVLLRIFRLMPLYWLILLAYYLDPLFGNFRFSWLTFSLFHGFSNNLNLTGLAQAWSINVEMTFYILAPFLCIIFRKRTSYLIASLILLFSVFFLIGQFWNHLDTKAFFYPVSFVIQNTFFGRSFQFLFGMGLAKMMLDENEYLEKLKFKTVIGFAGMIVSTVLISLFQKNIYSQGVDHPVGMMIHNFVLPFFISIFLAGLIFEKTFIQKVFASKIMVLLGNASFAFYLIHISYVNVKLKELFLLPDRNFIVLWLISIALYLLVEKPIYKLSRKLILS